MDNAVVNVPRFFEITLSAEYKEWERSAENDLKPRHIVMSADPPEIRVYFESPEAAAMFLLRWC